MNRVERLGSDTLGVLGVPTVLLVAFHRPFEEHDCGGPAPLGQTFRSAAAEHPELVLRVSGVKAERRFPREQRA
jgi:hypothetical protein